MIQLGISMEMVRRVASHTSEGKLPIGVEGGKIQLWIIHHGDSRANLQKAYVDIKY